MFIASIGDKLKEYKAINNWDYMIKEINNITLNQNEAYDLIIILDYDLYLRFY